MKRLIRDRLSYANVMATIAVFVALGGTSYALSLPRNSVGSAQLRSDSVGRSELRRKAVTSRAVRDRSVRLKDLSVGTRNALRGHQGPAGPQGPPGPTFSAAVNAAGALIRGSASSSSSSAPNNRLIGFSRPVNDCVATATLASVPGGTPDAPPNTAHVTVEHGSDGNVIVRTWDPDGSPRFLPFNLIVAC